MKKESVGAGAKRHSSRRLRRLLKEARAQRKNANGWWKRFRSVIRSGWLWLLVWVAEATLKKWLAVAGVAFLLLFALFLIQQEQGTPKFGLSHEFAVESEEFLPSIAGATNAPPVSGNRIDVFVNGDQYYPAILEAIGGAQHSIDIEAYIFWDAAIGQKLTESLIT